MDTIKLAVREREETGNGPARRLRAEGRIPGVTYGKGIRGYRHLHRFGGSEGGSGSRSERRPRA